MKYTFAEHITAIYLRLRIYAQIGKDVLFIIKKRSMTPVVMVPFDKRLVRQADTIIQKIRKATPTLQVQLLGSAKLKIYGKRDIDIYIECPPQYTKQSVMSLSKLFGKPTQVGSIVGWSYKEHEAEIEIVLINPQSLYYQTHLYMVSLLMNTPAYRTAYVNLKKRHNNLPRKIYSRNKTLFISSLIFRHVNDLVSSLILKRRKTVQSSMQNSLMQQKHANIHKNLKKPTVMIGITAFNEEKNILRILSQIVAQKQLNYSLSTVVVISDASTDETDAIVTTFSNFNIELIRNTKNIGKTASVTTLLKKAKLIGAELTIIIDADVYMPDKMAIARLVEPFLEDDSMMTVSGNTLPIQPKNGIERIAYFADTLSRDTYRRCKANTNYYICTDQLIALKTSDYSNMDLTKHHFLHDGAYYLLTLIAKKNFTVTEHATAYYQLPTTAGEYIGQMSRFLITDRQIEKEFHSLDLSLYLHLNARKKIGSFLSLSVRQPIIAMGFMCIQGYVYIRKALGIQNTPFQFAWHAQQSTKFPRTIGHLPVIKTIRNQSTRSPFTLVVRQEACGVRYIEKTYRGLFFMPVYRNLVKESVITARLRTRSSVDTNVSVPRLLYTQQTFASFTAYYEYADGALLQTLPAMSQQKAYTRIRAWARGQKMHTLFPNIGIHYFVLRVIPLWIISVLRYPEYTRQWIMLLFTCIRGIPTLSSLKTSLVHGDLSPDNIILAGQKIYLLDISMMSISYDAIEPIRILTNNMSPDIYKQFVGSKLVWDTRVQALAAYYFLADVVFNHKNRANLSKIQTLIHTYLHVHE